MFGNQLGDCLWPVCCKLDRPDARNYNTLYQAVLLIITRNFLFMQKCVMWCSALGRGRQNGHLALSSIFRKKKIKLKEKSIPNINNENKSIYVLLFFLST
jgi:hypothetical protein